MGRERKAVTERARPMREAWDELRDVYVDVLNVAVFEQQAAGAQAVQALTECTRRLREIKAEFKVEDDEDDDEAV